MPSPAIFLLIATLLPLAGAIVLLFVGYRMGTPLAGWVGSTLVALSFACTILAMVKWYDGKPGVVPPWGFRERPILLNAAWTPSGQAPRNARATLAAVGIYIDSLTIAMFGMVTLVAAVIHIFAISLLRDDPRFSRFFAAMGLLTFATLGLILSATILQVLFFGELIGIGTFLSVGWWRGRATNRIFGVLIAQLTGAGLIVGIGMLAHDLGNITLPALWAALGNAASGHAVAPSGGGILSAYRLTFIGISLFCAAAAMAAQFPLQFWLPRAMTSSFQAGSLIASATTTAAGIYLLARVYPILTPDVRLLICIIGVVTLTMAALIAVAQDDIRRMLAWTVISQLGYITLAVGVGSWIGALFHLLTHAFFIALLLLSALSITNAMSRSASLRAMGGLWNKIPVTMATFAIAVLAMAGAPYFSGHYSRLAIMTDTASYAIFAARSAGRTGAYWGLFILPVAVAFLTPYTMMRCWMKAFIGKSRTPAVVKHAREYAGQWGPLLALAVPSVIAGYSMNIPELLRASIVETNVVCNEMLLPGSRFTAFNETWATQPTSPVEIDEDELLESPSTPSPATIAHVQGAVLAHRWLKWSWIVGIALALGIYWEADAVPERLLKIAPLRWVHEWLAGGMFFDELYDWTIAPPIRAAIKFFSRSFTRLW